MVSTSKAITSGHLLPGKSRLQQSYVRIPKPSRVCLYILTYLSTVNLSVRCHNGSVNHAALPIIQIDRSSPVPLYFQVAQRLEHMIESGELPTGTRLDNEIDLADQLGLSRPTMRRAIAYLVDRGLVVRKRGLGTQIVHAKVRRQVGLTSLYDDLAKPSRSPRTQVLTFEVEP